ncbi:MAG: hypothetical protein IKC37_04990 [Clostridia bacterium]|nr:hypothetical protein [Clostridia bacterium]
MELLKKTISGLEKVVGRKIQYATEEKGLKTEGKTIFHFAFQGHNYVVPSRARTSKRWRLRHCCLPSWRGILRKGTP